MERFKQYTKADQKEMRDELKDVEGAERALVLERLGKKYNRTADAVNQKYLRMMSKKKPSKKKIVTREPSAATEVIASKVPTLKETKILFIPITINGVKITFPNNECTIEGVKISW